MVPDYLNGEPLAMNAVRTLFEREMGSRCDADMEQGYDFDAWLGRHESKDTRPPLDKVIEALKAEGVDTFGATGYCFGGMSLSLPLREFVAISYL